MKQKTKNQLRISQDEVCRQLMNITHQPATPDIAAFLSNVDPDVGGVN